MTIRNEKPTPKREKYSYEDVQHRIKKLRKRASDICKEIRFQIYQKVSFDLPLLYGLFLNELESPKDPKIKKRS
jgi:tetrahydromethanopterin S-methyltransferase subunit G